MITLILMLFLFVIWTLWTVPLGAGWLPLPKKVIRKMLEMSGIESNDILYDLGCGDGQVMIIASKEFGIRSVGIELDPIRYLITKIRLKYNRLYGNSKVIWGDFRKIDISEATIVVLYLSKHANNFLKSKLKNELKRGTKIITQEHPIKGWNPDVFDEKDQIYIYKIK